VLSLYNKAINVKVVSSWGFVGLGR